MHAAAHLPVLINALGHVAGTAAFSVLLALLVRSAWRTGAQPMTAPISAAALALAWNAGSLAVLLAPAGATAELLASASFTVLSLLPGVLLHLALGREHLWLRRAGYAVSASAGAMHAAEAAGLPWGSHEAGIDLITFGFGALAIVAAAVLARNRAAARGAGLRALAAMSLFLLAASFLHFGPEHGPASWTHELFLHHAGIPLALFVVLQDYRFLLLDVFVRWLGAGLLAAALAAGLLAGGSALGLFRLDAFEALPLAAFLTLTTAAIALYPWVRDRLRAWTQGAFFGRGDLAAATAALREATAEDEGEFLEEAARTLAGFVRARRRLLLDSAPDVPPRKSRMLDRGEVSRARWAEVAVPLRTSDRSSRVLLLGPREGGRRYLSEDLADLDRLAVEVAAELDRRRRDEQRRLLADAELEALRAQINPHFLFNSLNAVYGLIPRAAASARETLVHLADIFRYSLESREPFVTLERELEIVEAYLEIERQRLGERLRTRIDVEPEAARARIPALSIQPLVENAVRHGIGAKPEGGAVTVTGRVVADRLEVEVMDDGVGFEGEADAAEGGTKGHGLRNVRRRLELCYGERAGLAIESSPAGTRAAVGVELVESARPAAVVE